MCLVKNRWVSWCIFWRHAERLLNCLSWVWSLKKCMWFLLASLFQFDPVLSKHNIQKTKLMCELTTMYVNSSRRFCSGALFKTPMLVLKNLWNFSWLSISWKRSFCRSGCWYFWWSTWFLFTIWHIFKIFRVIRVKSSSASTQKKMGFDVSKKIKDRIFQIT